MHNENQEGRDEELCKFCPHNRAWHRAHRPRHLFTSQDDPRSINERIRPHEDPEDPKQPQPVAGHDTGGNATIQPIRGLPLDPVLRMALIDKGLLTSADLSNAEEKIRATSASFNAYVPTPPEERQPADAQEGTVGFSIGTTGDYRGDPEDRPASDAPRSLRAHPSEQPGPGDSEPRRRSGRSRTGS